MRLVREVTALALLLLGAVWLLYLSVFLFGEDDGGGGELWVPVAVCVAFAAVGFGTTLVALFRADRMSWRPFVATLAAAIAAHVVPFAVWSAAG